MKQQPPSPRAPEDDNIGWIKMLGGCVQATNQQGFSTIKKTASARRYADDRVCAEGQVAEKEKVGVEEEEAGRVSKDKTVFTTSSLSPEQKLRLRQFEGC